MNIGYARVSTLDQNLAAQLDALEKAGCEKIYQEKSSSAKKIRPELDSCLNDLRKGDCLIVTKLDRLGRSMKELIELMNCFEEKGIHFKCLTDPIDTSSASGEFLFHMMGAFAQLERSLIKERTWAGLEAARSRGRLGGRPPSIDTEKKELAYTLYMKNEQLLTNIAKAFRLTLFQIV